MSNLKRSTLIAIALTLICLGTAARAEADPLVLTIDNPNQLLMAGATVTFTGTLANNTPLAFIIRGSAIAHSTSGLVIDAALPPNFLPNPGPMMTVSGGIMSVTTSPFLAPGNYLATLSIDGSFADGSFFQAGQQVSFSVIDPSAVPEPASMILFGTGLIGAATGARRFRKRSNAICE